MVRNKLLNTNKNGWHQKLITFNVLKLRACTKPARLHCKQAKESSDDIYISDWQMTTDALEDATNYSPMVSVHTKLPLKSPWDFSLIGNVVSTTLEYDYKWELQFIRWQRL